MESLQHQAEKLDSSCSPKAMKATVDCEIFVRKIFVVLNFHGFGQPRKVFNAVTSSVCIKIQKLTSKLAAFEAITFTGKF